MKIPLLYQRTEYDCGPTSLLNALSFLLQREEIPPELLRTIMMYTLDCYNDKGEACKKGTSQMAMLFISNWLNHYAKATKFPLASQYLDGPQVEIHQNSEIVSALQQGGAVVLRLFYGCWHYVTLTGTRQSTIEVFDPYFRKQPFRQADIQLVTGHPFSKNREISFSVFNSLEKGTYAMGPVDTREAVILYNTNTRKTPERTIEYFL